MTTEQTLSAVEDFLGSRWYSLQTITDIARKLHQLATWFCRAFQDTRIKEELKQPKLLS